MDELSTCFFKLSLVMSFHVCSCITEIILLEWLLSALPLYVQSGNLPSDAWHFCRTPQTCLKVVRRADADVFAFYSYQFHIEFCVVDFCLIQILQGTVHPLLIHCSLETE